MTELGPRYGDTQLDEEELQYLTPLASRLLGPRPARAAVYDLETQVQILVAERHIRTAVEGEIGPGDILDDAFLRELHAEMFGDVWSWAGQQRRRETNIGVQPGDVGPQLRQALGSLRFRIDTDAVWPAQQVGIAAHAELVRVHPFRDGNGRLSRLVGDLVFVSLQETDDPLLYDWRVDRTRYITLLRDYDHNRDAGPLTELIAVKRLGQMHGQGPNLGSGLGM